MKPLIERIDSIALNIVRVTLESGDQYTVQELDGKLRCVVYKRLEG